MIDRIEIIKRAAIIFILILLVIVVGFLMIRYEIEGETNLPFTLSKIMVISTADGRQEEENKLTVTQCNDLYLYIDKMQEDDYDSMIKNVYIENIEVLYSPEKGTVKFYRPNDDDGLIYEYDEDLLIDDSITYEGGSKTDTQTLTISNQGGIIGFRTCVDNVGEISIDPNADVKNVGYINDGTLLKQAQIAIQEIRYNIGFDVILELADGKMYKGYVNLTLPIEDVDKGGVKGIEKANTNDVVFKRIKIK